MCQITSKKQVSPHELPELRSLFLSGWIQFLLYISNRWQEHHWETSSFTDSIEARQALVKTRTSAAAGPDLFSFRLLSANEAMTLHQLHCVSSWIHRAKCSDNRQQNTSRDHGGVSRELNSWAYWKIINILFMCILHIYVLLQFIVRVVVLPLFQPLLCRSHLFFAINSHQCICFFQ